MNTARLLVLLPLRDARLPLRKWSASLFAAGVPGAWSFPWVIPLAEINRPLSGEKLKLLARALRRHINAEGGIFKTASPNFIALKDKLKYRIFGPTLQTKLPDDFFMPIDEDISGHISPQVIGSALLHGTPPEYFPAPPDISFRAAALANMIYHEKDGYFFEWKIGPLSWLPKNT